MAPLIGRVFLARGRRLGSAIMAIEFAQIESAARVLSVGVMLAVLQASLDGKKRCDDRRAADLVAF